MLSALVVIWLDGQALVLPHATSVEPVEPLVAVVRLTRGGELAAAASIRRYLASGEAERLQVPPLECPPGE